MGTLGNDIFFGAWGRYSDKFFHEWQPNIGPVIGQQRQKKCCCPSAEKVHIFNLAPLAPFKVLADFADLLILCACFQVDFMGGDFNDNRESASCSFSARFIFGSDAPSIR